jgi:hypothetical protein
MPDAAASPFAHFVQSSNEIWATLCYVEEKVSGSFVRPYAIVWQRHSARLHTMMLIGLIEAFERYLKEVAAVCVNHLARHVVDDRFDIFSAAIKGSFWGAHFEAQSLGHALCESTTWFGCKLTNDRFRAILRDPLRGKGAAEFNLFEDETPSQKAGFATLEAIWQLRHTAVHNVGVVTRSDAVKLRLLAKRNVESPRVLSPSRDDIRYLKQCLRQVAESCNERIGKRLADVLTVIRVDNPSLFVAQEVADAISRDFGFSLTVDGSQGTP